MSATGPTKPKLSLEAIGELQRAIADTRKVKPDTLAGLIRRWRCSPEWDALSVTTKETWGYSLNNLELKWGSTPLSFWSDPRMVRKVVQWRDSRADTPRAADIGVMVLRMLLDYGRLRGDVSTNVAAGIPSLYRGGDRADIIWTVDDFDRFQWHAVMADQPHISDGLWLAALTGLRRADLVSLNKSQVLDAAISKKALKTSRGRRFNTTIPRLPELDDLLVELDSRQRADGVSNLLVNSFGRPWTPGGFSGSFNRVRDAANIVHMDQDTGLKRRKHLHDVRGTFCTKLIVAGVRTGRPLTDQEVAGVMGWAPERVAGIRRTYVDQAQVVVAIGERLRSKL